MELTIVMPCLDEAETLETCIRKAQGYLLRAGVDGEVVIADNGSSDGSQEIAIRCGARLVEVAEKGYGAALIGGITEARGTYVIMGDADDSYDFEHLDPFVEHLRDGADLVMGNRFAGGIAPDAMPPLHRYLGNPVLSFIGRLFFRSDIRDFHCGLRGFRRDTILALGLSTTGMEFASEMVVKASLCHLRIDQVPTTLRPDGRSRPPHLRSWRDGWRHLRFLMLYSPRWLFFYPGVVLMVLGVTLGAVLSITPIDLGSFDLDVSSLVVSSGLAVIGYQSIWFAILSKSFASREGLLPMDVRVDRFRQLFPLEKALAVAAVAILLGAVGLAAAVLKWDFSPQDARSSLRLVVPSMTVLILGVQTALCSLLLGVLSLPSSRSSASALVRRPVP
ncbi:glycosyltransferase family 2 protein [Dermatobacter hominis]|uniref:glycosyltransferase family 2 protein n=1 Tax=Dermatobacter hominis TaxID=2884263 RepID=UPI001D117CE7|nr:glycosyltransferase family 2 protein [Dermatobacter hominis]UDY35586.1 glycosyltransferase family 2 protein [Dermatobacter hominis]